MSDSDEQKYDQVVTDIYSRVSPGGGYPTNEVMGVMPCCGAPLLNPPVHYMTCSRYVDARKTCGESRTNHPSVYHFDGKWWYTLNEQLRPLPDTVKSRDEALEEARKIMEAVNGI